MSSEHAREEMPSTQKSEVILTNVPEAYVKVVEPVDHFTALAVRGAIIGTGLLGLTLYVKNSRLFAKYRHVKSIPKQYYQNEVLLNGVVREVTPHGVIKIEHKPVFSISRFFSRASSKNVSLLNLRLAGLNVSPEGLTYLRKELRLPNRRVTFGVVKPATENADAADGVVNVKNKLFVYTNLSVELLRKGFARVLGPEDVTHLDALRSNAAYSRLVTRLLISEHMADRRGVGIWERTTWVESLRSLPASAGQIIRASAVTKLVILLFDILRDLSLILLNVLRQSYYLSLTLGSYAGDAYRSFARGVDRVVNFYTRLKSGKNKATVSEKKE